MINVVVVEDSPVVQEFMAYILDSDPGIRVVGKAGDGQEALEVVKRKRPSVITMDIHMPRIDGFEATRRIMESDPTPIVIVSASSSITEATTAFRAIEAGALAVVERPPGIGHPDHETRAEHLIQTVKLMSEVKVVRRWPHARRVEATQVARAVDVRVSGDRPTIKVIAIGASTGGPLAIQTILSGLPGSFPVPILIVQHMSSGFTEGFAEWLAQSCSIPVKVAQNGELALPGHVYVAPESHQMNVRTGGILWLSQEKSQSNHQPSVASLFHSVTQVYGPCGVGILLTGMGKDGAQELKGMKAHGAITIAQSKESSVVHGMPGEAISLDAALHVLSPVQIAELLNRLVEEKSSMHGGGPSEKRVEH